MEFLYAVNNFGYYFCFGIHCFDLSKCPPQNTFNSNGFKCYLPNMIIVEIIWTWFTPPTHKYKFGSFNAHNFEANSICSNTIWILTRLCDVWNYKLVILECVNANQAQITSTEFLYILALYGSDVWFQAAVIPIDCLFSNDDECLHYKKPDFKFAILSLYLSSISNSNVDRRNYFVRTSSE